LHATGRRLTLSFAWIVACAVALVVAAPAPAPAQTTAGVAYFPNTRAPVQIAREVNLQRAAQAGVVKLESKEEARATRSRWSSPASRSPATSP
jgi:ABC-type nitrate/sulfonate/bicarbonate transport system substrate-binding protein